MENASKALLMAAEVLISIVIISALVLMFNSLTSYQGEKDQIDLEAQVIKFNNKYEAYNVEDVRGNDLYSLINKVVDYNERQSSEGEEGKDFNYQPMEIYVNLISPKGKNARDEFSFDGTTYRIFKTGTKDFTINSTNNTFNKLFENDEVNITEMIAKYPSGALSNLTLALTSTSENTRIFIPDDDFKKLTDEEQKQIIYNFNNAYGSNKLKTDNIKKSWNEIQNSKEDVYTYYEYLQFTRAHFKCTGVEYNQGTGRIVKMNFQFTGKIN